MTINVARVDQYKANVKTVKRFRSKFKGGYWGTYQEFPRKEFKEKYAVVKCSIGMYQSAKTAICIIQNYH